MIPYRSRSKKGKAKIPVVTLTLISICIAVFAYEFSLSPSLLTEFIVEHGFTPLYLEPLDLITSMFIHGGWVHIIVNLLYLWVFGDKVEAAFGAKKFFYFYFLAGLVASLTQYALNPDSAIPIIGASGAIAGVLGYSLISFPKTQVSVLIPIFVFLRRAVVPAWLLLSVWFVLQLLAGYLSISQSDPQGIAIFSHIGGFVFGLIFGRFFSR